MINFRAVDFAEVESNEEKEESNELALSETVGRPIKERWPHPFVISDNMLSSAVLNKLSNQEKLVCGDWTSIKTAIVYECDKYIDNW